MLIGSFKCMDREFICFELYWMVVWEDYLWVRLSGRIFSYFSDWLLSPGKSHSLAYMVRIPSWRRLDSLPLDIDI